MYLFLLLHTLCTLRNIKDNIRFVIKRMFEQGEANSRRDVLDLVIQKRGEEKLNLRSKREGL